MSGGGTAGSTDDSPREMTSLQQPLTDSATMATRTNTCSSWFLQIHNRGRVRFAHQMDCGPGNSGSCLVLVCRQPTGAQSLLVLVPSGSQKEHGNTTVCHVIRFNVTLPTSTTQVRARIGGDNLPSSHNIRTVKLPPKLALLAANFNSTNSTGKRFVLLLVFASSDFSRNFFVPLPDMASIFCAHKVAATMTDKTARKFMAHSRSTDPKVFLFRAINFVQIKL